MNTSSSGLVRWHLEFAKVIGCVSCTRADDPNLLRDSGENVPQPGYIGAGYEGTGLLLVGQNPGLTIPSTAAKDLRCFAALSALRAERTEQRYAELQAILLDLIPDRPVQRRYFPLKECELGLEDFACCNLVRCRTGKRGEEGRLENTPRKGHVPATCNRMHFGPWLEMLKPSCVVFIGHWECDHGGSTACDERGICYEAVNRGHLFGPERAANRSAVVDFVRRHVRSARGMTSGSIA